MSKYSDIIKRLEEATGPDRELDAVIWLETTEGATRVKTPVKSNTDAWPPYVIDETRDPDGRLITVQPYTASIDAAVALVERMLPGWFWRCGRTSLFPNGWAFLAKYAPDHCDRGDEFAAADGKAQTPAIAILLSLFRALEAKETGA